MDELRDLNQYSPYFFFFLKSILFWFCLHVYFDLRQSHLKIIETSHFIFFILIMSFYEILEFSNRDNIKLRITICIHNSRITALKIISISVDT